MAHINPEKVLDEAVWISSHANTFGERYEAILFPPPPSVMGI